MEKQLESRRLYEGRIVSVRVDRVQLPSGRETTREVVEHPGAVAVLPVNVDGSILLVRQFRYAVNRELLEVPAGTREPDESAVECALREIEEEVGVRAGSLERMATFYISPGWCNEEMVIFRATNLQDARINPDDDEVIDVVQVAPDQIPGLIGGGEVADAKTITALLLHLKNPHVQAE